jgi:hypothetical protein
MALREPGRQLQPTCPTSFGVSGRDWRFVALVLAPWLPVAHKLSVWVRV